MNWDKIGFVGMMLLAVVTLLLEMLEPGTAINFALLGTMIVMIAAYISWELIKEKFRVAERNTKRLNTLESNYGIMKTLCKHDKRIALLEKARKGNYKLDPGVFLIFATIALFIIYLRVRGIL